MERRAEEELINLFQDAIKVGGAALEMRVRRFASFVRGSDEALAQRAAALVTGASRSLRRGDMAQPSPVDADTKLALVRIDDMGSRAEPFLDSTSRAVLEQLIRERQSADRLAAAGLTPVKSLLMSGPPGVGKTMTAGWLASQLGLPLLTLDLASVMSSYLGKTGANLRAVLSHAQERPCVLLLDEFDSIAKRRDDDSDVGELKRLVTVILQTIDDWSASSLLVAATNHGELLDPAVWRRFDVTLKLEVPDQDTRGRFLCAQGIADELAKVIAAISEGQTFSAMARAVEAARKQSLLEDIAFDEALAAWAASPGIYAGKSPAAASRHRRELMTLVYHSRRMSAREIADVLGTSHTTVNRSLKRLKGEVDAGT